MATPIYRRNAVTAGLKEMAEKGDRGARRALAALAVDDPELAIPWPLPVTIRSQKDMSAPTLASVLNLLG